MATARVLSLLISYRWVVLNHRMWMQTRGAIKLDFWKVNASFGLLAYGNGSGLVIVDFIQVVANLMKYGCK